MRVFIELFTAIGLIALTFILMILRVYYEFKKDPLGKRAKYKSYSGGWRKGRVVFSGEKYYEMRFDESKRIVKVENNRVRPIYFEL